MYVQFTRTDLTIGSANETMKKEKKTNKTLPTHQNVVVEFVELPFRLIFH